ncbi:Nac domain-containing protein [Thalictrum thalictroides]|uniref:Nac domain-containing protein n=1 Tax=Thalictrum thalictroides TaxID=46969 RepID=A0A7J6VFG7_THATH|nr:Nac domain-containing protein [Thalictrum thalictroides]
MGDDNVNLPPGFRFYPTDEELVVHFLQRKAARLPCHPDIIPDLNLYPYDPWDLNGKALSGGNQWYYFSRRTSNRMSANGFWQPLGIDEPINATSNSDRNVGMKKYLVFCLGEGIKTNWIMHEYRLSDTASTSSSRSSKKKTTTKDASKWVLCRVFEDNDGSQGSLCDNNDQELSCLDEVFLSLDDDFDEINYPN